MTANDVAFLRKLPLLPKRCMHATSSMRRKAQCSGALLHMPLNTVFMLLAVCEEKTPLTVLAVHQTAVHIILQIYSFIIIHCKNNLAFINEEWLSSSVAQKALFMCKIDPFQE